jgi:hypothetical protein
MSFDWKNVASMELKQNEMRNNDFIRALVIRKEWKTILGLATTCSDLFLRALHCQPVRKELFSDFTAEEYIALLDRSNEAVQNQILQIMLERFDENPDVIGKAGQDLFFNPVGHPFVYKNIVNVAALLPIDMVKKILTVPSKGATLYLRIKGSLENPNSDNVQYLKPSEFVSLRNIVKRQSILKVVFEEFEKNIKVGNPGLYENHIMSFISHYAPAWTKCAPLRAQMKEIIEKADLSSVFCDNTYLLFINGSIPVPTHFDFKLFIQNNLMKKIDFVNSVISVLAADAAKESIRKTNLRRLIKNIPKITMPLGVNMFMTLRSEALEKKDSKAAVIYARIEKEFQAVAAKQIIKHGDASMLRFVAYPLACKPTAVIGNLSVIFNSQKSLEIIRKTIEDVIAEKNTIIKISADAYTDRMIQMLNAVGAAISHFDDEFHDDFILEVYRHPTNSGKINHSFEFDTISALNCLLQIRDLKKISSVFKYKDLDEFGFAGKRSLNFPPLQTSKTKKAEAIEFESVHPFELSLISSRLLAHQNEQISQAARSCYQLFTDKILSLVVKNPALAKNACDMYFRLCRYCVRDDPNLVEQVVVSPFIINAAVKAKSDVIERVIAMLPSTSMGKVLVNLFYTKYEAFDDDSVLEEGANLVKVVLPRCFENVEQTYEPHFYKISQEPRGLECTRAAVDAVNAIVYNEKFRNMIFKSFGEKQTQNVYCIQIDTNLLSFDVEKKVQQLYYNINHKALYEALKQCYTIAQEFKPREPNSNPSNKMVQSFNVANKVKDILERLGPLKVQIVRDFTALNKMYGADANFHFDRIISKYSIDLKFTEATAPIFANLFPDQPVAYVDKYSDFYEMINFFMNFDPTITTIQYQKNLQMKKTPSIFNKSIRIFAEKDPASALLSVPSVKYIKEGKKKFTLEPICTTFYERILTAILSVDSEKTTQLLLKYPGSFVEVCGMIGMISSKCSTFGGSTKIIANLLNEVFKDLLTVDPEPTEEEEFPQKAETLFTKFKAVKPEQKLKRNRAGTPKNVAKIDDKRFSMNVALIAKLCGILREPIFAGKIDFSIFSESVLNFFKLSPELITERIGNQNSNFHNFAAQLAELYVSHVDFGKETKEDNWAASLPTEFEIIARMLAVPVLIHKINSALISKVVMMPTVEERRAIITALESITLHDEMYAPGLAFRIKVISLALSPKIMGMPLPQSSIDYIQKISKNENLTIDICRTIASAAVGYFQYQSILGAGPYQFDEIFEVLKSMNIPKFNLLTPHFSRLISNDIAMDFKCEDIIPTSAQPSSVVFDPIVSPIEMPDKGVWTELHEKICATFIANGILSKNDKIAQLTMKTLTKLSSARSITTIIAPRIAELINNFSLNDNIISLNFAITFCMQKENSQYTETIEALVSAFKRFYEALENRAIEQAAAIWVGSVDYKQFNALNKIFSTTQNCIDDLLISAVPEQAEYISKICSRLLEVSTSERPLAVIVPDYKNFANFLTIASYPQLGELYKNQPFTAILDFVNYAFDKLKKDFFEFKFSSMLSFIYSEKMDEEGLKATEKIAHNIACESRILAVSTKSFFMRLRNNGVDITPFIKYAGRFIENSDKCFMSFNVDETNEITNSLSEVYRIAKNLSDKREAEIKNRAGTVTTAKMNGYKDRSGVKQTAFSNSMIPSFGGNVTLNAAFINIFNF